MNPIESVAPNLYRPLQSVHHKHDPRLPEAGAATPSGEFAEMLAQQTTEPSIEEPAEPTIELKARKSRKELQRQNRPAGLQPAGTQRNY